MTKETWGAISAGMCFAGSLPYMWQTFRSTIRPHAFSWLIWGSSSTIVGIAQYFKQAGAGDWVNWCDAITSYIIAGLALRIGKSQIHKTDWIALGVALLALPLWYVTNEPLTAVLLISATDLIGFIPTYRKSWSRPRQETAKSYAIYGVTFLVSLLAVENYNAATIAYPVFLALGNLGLVTLLLWRRIAVAS